ncbi:hypothetical protein [Microbacterium aerolatum]|uniref:hypothetical protein n=1 Tax=Microbacterium aerolatum TaxID=153731 RepID=UPI0038500974
MNINALSHTHDPEESRIAAINLSGHATERVMHAVVDILDQQGPMTPAELEHHYFQHQQVNDWPQVAFYSIHRRVSQLKKHVGCLIAVGRKDGAQLLNLADNPRQAHVDISDYFRKDAA